VAKTHRMQLRHEDAGYFRKRATNYRALLQKMTDEDITSDDSTPPCTALTSLAVLIETYRKFLNIRSRYFQCLAEYLCIYNI